MFDFAPADLPPPPAGSYGYRGYVARAEDPALGIRDRFGDDRCYRAVGWAPLAWDYFADGTRTARGATDQSFVWFKYRSEECPWWPPDLPLA